MDSPNYLRPLPLCPRLGARGGSGLGNVLGANAPQHCSGAHSCFVFRFRAICLRGRIGPRGLPTSQKDKCCFATLKNEEHGGPR
eukprot:6705100-Prymnesium_polylepis.1